MKIVCESCGAKYSIADEKVAGKVFKIRCKKCSAVIVVKGDQQESGDESTRVFDYGADAVWHVVVGGDQQGPLTPRQIGEMLADGRIDWEAYVWREGMDGWLPAKDVDQLVSSVMAESEGGAPAAGKPAHGGQVFGGSSDMGADPFAASDDGGLSGVMAQSSGGGADLFAQSAKSPFSGSDHDEERVSNGSNPRVSSPAAMTGQRNENSVLFSLSNLQALATGSSAPATSSGSSRPKPGMASGEGSGLIDIRALASATQAVPERANGHSKERVEDLLAVGSVNSTFSASTLAAPVAQEKPDRSKFLMFGMGGAILALAAAVGYLAMREPPAQATASLTNTPSPAAQAAVAPTPTAPTAAAPSEPAEEAEEKDDKPGAAARDNDSSRDRGSKPKRSGGGGDAPRAAADKPASAEPAAPVSKPSSSGDKSIDDLLNSALGGEAKPKPAASKPAAADLPQSPSRDEVISAMKGVSGAVSACGNGQSGVAMCKISVSGATGKVTNVDVSGQFAGTPVASCVTRAVSKAKFPKFQQSSFSVSYPFKL
jgi:predicted Zn finger-like uncharacterized protein